MDYRDAIEYLEESKCDQNQGEDYQERHNKILDIAIKAIESQIFFENTVGDIRDWFVDNKNQLLDSASNWFDDCNVDGMVDKVNLDFMIEDLVDETQKGILNVLDSYIDGGE